MDALVPLTGFLILVSMAAACAETNEMRGFDEFVADYEPMPCSVNSFQETAPFDPIILNPYEPMAQIDDCKSGEVKTIASSTFCLPLTIRKS